MPYIGTTAKDPSNAVLKQNNLSDIQSSSSARTNLGLGTVSTKNEITNTELSTSLRTSILNSLVPVGAVIPFAGINPPDNSWALANGETISRSEYPDYLNHVTVVDSINTNSNTTVTMSNTAVIFVGMTVEASGVPSGTTILSVDSNTAFTLSANATATATDVNTRFFIYGAGDGSTTLNLPDLRGEFIRGTDNGRGVDADRTLGSSQVDQMQGHRHETLTGNQFVSSTGGGAYSGGGQGGADTSTGSGTLSDGNGVPRTGAETRPRNVALNYMVKVLKTFE